MHGIDRHRSFLTGPHGKTHLKGVSRMNVNDFLSRFPAIPMGKPL